LIVFDPVILGNEVDKDKALLWLLAVICIALMAMAVIISSKI
jgi:hypothetical protein